MATISDLPAILEVKKISQVGNGMTRRLLMNEQDAWTHFRFSDQQFLMPD
jgi:hypothetical protein